MDFTFTAYRKLLKILFGEGFVFQPFAAFMQTPLHKGIILRHDIDKLPANALKMAQLEHGLGVCGSYYFRVIPGVWEENVMKQIVALGHELGYHYEDLAIARGDTEKAIQHFETQLNRFREIYPVNTICMHGSPLSRHDNRALWKSHDYRDFGIIGEPYFDVDYTKVFYLTDTGRKWNNGTVGIRDRVESGFDIKVNSTFHLADLAGQGALPDQMMITVHPQRWHDRVLPWIQELVWQNVKNGAKWAWIRSKADPGG